MSLPRIISRLMALFGLGVLASSSRPRRQENDAPGEAPAPGAGREPGTPDGKARHSDVAAASKDESPAATVQADGGGSGSQSPVLDDEAQRSGAPSAASTGERPAGNRSSTSTATSQTVGASEPNKGSTRQSARSNWSMADPAAGGTRKSDTAFEGRFSSFGGSVVGGSVRQGGEGSSHSDNSGSEAGKPSPNTPHGTPLGAPHPDGPTPDKTARRNVAADPLAVKHEAKGLDGDVKAVDYGTADDISKNEAGSASGLSSSIGEGQPQASAQPNPKDESYVSAFRVAGVSAPLVGAPAADDAADHSATGTTEGHPAPLAADHPASGIEPQRLPEPRNGKPDDLTAIKGIGPTIEHLLFEHGVFHYDQIASWGAAETRWIDQMTGFAGRVDREGWQEQAKTLAERASGNA